MKRKTESHVDRTGIAAVLQASKWRRQRTTEDVDQDTSQTVFLLVELTLTEAEKCPHLWAMWNPGLHSFQVKATQNRLSTRFPAILMSKFTIIYPWRWGQAAKRLSGKVQWCACHWAVHIPGGSRTILGGRAGAAEDLRSDNRISMD